MQLMGDSLAGLLLCSLRLLQQPCQLQLLRNFRHLRRLCSCLRSLRQALAVVVTQCLAVTHGLLGSGTQPAVCTTHYSDAQHTLECKALTHSVIIIISP